MEQLRAGPIRDPSGSHFLQHIEIPGQKESLQEPSHESVLRTGHMCKYLEDRLAQSNHTSCQIGLLISPPAGEVETQLLLQ